MRFYCTTYGFHFLNVMAFHSSLVTEILLNIPVVLLQRLSNIQNIIIPQSLEKVYDISLFIGSVLAPE